MTCPLSCDLKIACEIYHFNLKREPIWFGKLVDYHKKIASMLDPVWIGPLNDEFKTKIIKMTVSHSLDTLEDWMITKSHYGLTGTGFSTRLIEIDTDYGGHKIKELYEQYWRKE